MQQSGLEAHKEGIATRVPKSLGMTIDAETLELSMAMENLCMVTCATLWLLQSTTASGKQLQRLLGH